MYMNVQYAYINFIFINFLLQITKFILCVSTKFLVQVVWHWKGKPEVAQSSISC